MQDVCKAEIFIQWGCDRQSDEFISIVPGFNKFGQH